MAKISEHQFSEAIEDFTAAIEENSSDAYSYHQRGVCYLNLRQFELSLSDMNTSIELDNQYAYFYACRGFLKTKMKDMKGAVADYEKSLELDPQNDITYNNMGLVLESMGQMNKARRYFKSGDRLLGNSAPKREEHTPSASRTTPAAKASDVAAEAKPEKTTVFSKKGRRMMVEVLTKKGAFRDFLTFILHGFTFKKNDQSPKS